MSQEQPETQEVTLLLDQKVIDWFRKNSTSEEDFQAHINAVLRFDVEQRAMANELPTKLRTPAEAAARIRELRKGHHLPEGMTIRAMIDEGRD
jgi:hypothetical protein